MQFAGIRVLAAGGCQAVHHQVHLTQILLDQVNGLFLDLVGEGVTVDVLGVQPGFVGGLLEGGGVVPAGGGGAFALGGFFKKDTDGAGATTKGCGNTGGQAVTGGGPDHQHSLRCVCNIPLLLHKLNLPIDVGSAADGVRCGTDESFNPWCNNHYKYLYSVLLGCSLELFVGAILKGGSGDGQLRLCPPG